VADLGAHVYFRKPTDLGAFMEIGAVVQSLLGGNSARAASGESASEL
jgi:hypothetical protein